MPRKPTKRDNPEQSRRFIDTAEEVGADDERALERAFEKIRPAVKRTERSSKK